MEVAEFRSKIKLGTKLIVDRREFVIKEIIKFRFDDGSFYIKCFLSDDYVFADDLNENIFLLVKEIKTPFQQPFLEKLNFDNKKFKFLYTAHAVAEEISGEDIFRKGDGERFWDYKAKDDSYLSFGINDTTKERLDFYGEIVKTNKVNLTE